MNTETPTPRTDAAFENILRYSTRCSLSLRNHIAKAKESHSQLECELIATNQKLQSRIAELEEQLAVLCTVF